MLRIAGACLIACAAAGTGFFCAHWSKRRIAAVESAMQAVELLHPAVILQLQPPERAVHDLAGRNKLLAALDAAKYPYTADDLCKAGLSRTEADILLALFRAIPCAAAGQDMHFTAAMEQLALQRKAQQASWEKAGELYPKLGLLGGLAAFLMLI